jgi:Rv2632c-like
MKATGDSKLWTVEVLLEQTDNTTDAEAVLEIGADRYAGWGRARRNPIDPKVPQIGEELAAARALSDLAHKVLDAAARAIEDFEGHPVQVHP